MILLLGVVTKYVLILWKHKKRIFKYLNLELASIISDRSLLLPVVGQPFLFVTPSFNIRLLLGFKPNDGRRI
jgi:hypothetical protein